MPTSEKNPVITLVKLGSVVALIVRPRIMKQRTMIDLRLWSDVVISLLIKRFILFPSAYPCE